MLLTIGEQKVNSLESSGVLEVDVAKATLAEVSRSVQGEGWHFNTDNNVRFIPDINGNITLPANCLRVWQKPRSVPEAVQRGTRLYNKTDRSYIFESPIHLSLLYCLNFDELIPAARQYIARQASRLFQERISGSQVTEEFVIREEARARIQLEAADAEAAGYNITLDNHPTVRTVMRDRW